MTVSGSVVLGVIGNVLSVVGIVICNKYITEIDGYNFMVFLSFLHFIFTALGTRILMAANVFSYQPAPMSGVMPVAIVCISLLYYFLCDTWMTGKFVICRIYELKFS
jgi:hypothetical protein